MCVCVMGMEGVGVGVEKDAGGIKHLLGFEGVYGSFLYILIYMKVMESFLCLKNKI